MAKEKKPPPDHPQGGPPGQGGKPPKPVQTDVRAAVVAVGVAAMDMQLTLAPPVEPPPEGVRTDVAVAVAARGRVMANTWVIPAGGTTLPEVPVTPALVDTGNAATNGTNLQNAINAATWGATLVLQAGAVYEGNFTLPNKGTPPTGTDADYITLTSSSPSQTPAALSNYPASQTRITTAMAAGMPVVRTATSYPVFSFAVQSKYWKLERLNITNRDNGFSTIALIAQAEPVALNSYPDRVIMQYNWMHPIEETGTVLSSGNLARTVENTIYLDATHLTIQYNALQGFTGQQKYNDPGHFITSCNLLTTRWGDQILVQNNLLEAWTYSFFTGGSDMPDWLVTEGATVTGCDANSCVFSSTAGLAAGDPVSVRISNASAAQCGGSGYDGTHACYGAAYVASIVGSTVTFVDPLCHSYDGNNTCTSVGVVPVNGNLARWGGLQPQNITFRQNIFAHYPEWTALVDGVNCGGKGYLEVKACVNCVFDGNIFTGCSGPTVTVRNQGADFCWASLDGLTFSNNYFKNSNNTFVAALDDSSPAPRSANVSFTNNLMVGVAPTLNTYFPGGQLSGGFVGGDHVTLSHNTVLWANPSANGTSQYNYYRDFICRVARPMTNLTVRDNIFGAGISLCFTADLSSTLPFINCWPSATVDHNVIVNTDGWNQVDVDSWWPWSGNTTTVTSWSAVGFTSAPPALDATGNYRLTSGSAYHNAASDGSDIGCNITALNAALGFTAA